MVGMRALTGVDQGTVTDIVRVVSSIVPVIDGIVNENPVMFFVLLFGVSEDGSEHAQKKRMTVPMRMITPGRAVTPSRAPCFLIVAIIA